MPNFDVMMSADTRVRLPEGEGWLLQGLPCPTGKPVELMLSTSYDEIGLQARLPGRLLAEFSGEATSLEEALAAFEQVGVLVVPLISVAVNAFIPALEFDLAVDRTDGVDSHAFRQWFRTNPTIEPGNGRIIDKDQAQGLINALFAGPGGPRCHRAAVQYQEALRVWSRTRELTAVMHLWMAVEALTKVFLDRELTSTGWTAEELCQNWGIEKRQLDPEIRKRLIFHGDEDVYREAKGTSDGLEHMFDDFPKLHKRAAASRDNVAAHVRQALLDVLNVGGSLRQQLEAPSFDKPLVRTTMNYAIDAELRGPAGGLAAEGFRFPHFVGTRRISRLEPKDKGYTLDFEHNLRLLCADGVTATTSSIWTEVPVDEITTKVNPAALDSSSTNNASPERAWPRSRKVAGVLLTVEGTVLFLLFGGLSASAIFAAGGIPAPVIYSVGLVAAHVGLPTAAAAAGIALLLRRGWGVVLGALTQFMAVAYVGNESLFTNWGPGTEVGKVFVAIVGILALANMALLLDGRPRR